MAHTLQAMARWQDENAVQVPPSKGVAANENALFTPFRGAGGKQAPGGAGLGKADSFTTGRRALGNITNTQQRKEGGVGKGGPSKGASGGLSVRKALGDITNSTPGGNNTGSRRSDAVLQPAGAQAKVQQALPARREDPLLRQAEQLAANGVERRAGASWEQLQAQEQARGRKQVASRLAAMASTTSTYGLPGVVMQPQLHMDLLLQPEEVPEVPSPRGSFYDELTDADMLEVLFPDTCLPDLEEDLQLPSTLPTANTALPATDAVHEARDPLALLGSLAAALPAPASPAPPVDATAAGRGIDGSPGISPANRSMLPLEEDDLVRYAYESDAMSIASGGSVSGGTPPHIGRASEKLA